eukprot:2314109-Prymnesium_polylepis.1
MGQRPGGCVGGHAGGVSGIALRSLARPGGGRREGVGRRARMPRAHFAARASPPPPPPPRRRLPRSPRRAHSGAPPR